MSSSTDPADHLHALGDAVPVGTPSVPDLIAGGRRIRRRRTTLATLSAAAAVVLVVAGSAVAVSLGGGRTPHETAAAVAPTPDPGYKYVGRGSVVVEVPAGWGAITYPQCGRGGAGYYFVYTDSLCPLIPDLPPVPPPTVGLQVSERGAVSHPLSCHKGSCYQVVVRDGVQVVANGSRAEVERVIGSLRTLPGGLTTVPFVAGMTQEAAASALKLAGLALQNPPPGQDVIIVDVSPGFGAVVPVGRTVNLGRSSAMVQVTDPNMLVGRWGLYRLGNGDPTTDQQTLTFGAADESGPLTITSCAISSSFTVTTEGRFRVPDLPTQTSCVGTEEADNGVLLRATSAWLATETGQLTLRDAAGNDLATFTAIAARVNNHPLTDPTDVLGRWRPLTVTGRPELTHLDILDFVDAHTVSTSGGNAGAGTWSLSSSGTFDLDSWKYGDDMLVSNSIDNRILLAATHTLLVDRSGRLFLYAANGSLIATYARVPGPR